MKKYLLFIATAAVVCALPGISLADSIKGKWGVTGRVGLMAPSDIEFTAVTGYAIAPSLNVAVINIGKAKADTTFAGGGGFIYGVTDNFAVEVDVTHTPRINYDYSGQKLFEITTTNVSLELQYRFYPENALVPYLGVGADFMISDGTYQSGDTMNIETLVGEHVNAGVDFFVTKRIALNADFRSILAPRADIHTQNASLLKAEYDPISFVALFGVRFFLN
jgi:outer membrane protein